MLFRSRFKRRISNARNAAAVTTESPAACASGCRIPDRGRQLLPGNGATDEIYHPFPYPSGSVPYSSVYCAAHRAAYTGACTYRFGRSVFCGADRRWSFRCYRGGVPRIRDAPFEARLGGRGNFSLWQGRKAFVGVVLISCGLAYGLVGGLWAGGGCHA